MNAKDWVEVVQTAGGWGVAAIEFYVIRWLVREMKDKDEKIFGLLNQTNTILKLLRGEEEEE